MTPDLTSDGMQDGSAAVLWEQVMQRVARDGDCFRWTGALTTDGYPRLTVRGRQVHAHRLVWALTHGRDPGDLVVRHTCDNPWCVKPSHLLTGTHADNQADKVARNRQARGEASGRAKLTADDVRTIREAYDEGWPISALARHFGVTHKLVRMIVDRRLWRHLDAA